MKQLLIVIIINIFIPSCFCAKGSTERISNLITPVSYFVNHVKQLTKINDNLGKYNTTSIVGMSGVGKTQIVRTYAYENSDKYEVIWFIDCSLDINQEFLKLAKELNKKKRANINEQAELVKNGVLDYLKNQNNFLLVLDNLKISENLKVKDIIEWDHNGHVIFVSQDSNILPNVVKIANFEKRDCAKLAEAILDEPTKSERDFLSQHLRGYPILVVQTAQLLNQHKGLEMETYKKKVMESSDKIKLNINIATSKLSSSASELLLQIALINNQLFSKDFLRYISSNKESLDDDIYQISKYSLITNIDPNAENHLFEMHDITVQTILNNQEKDNVKNIVEKTVANLIDSTPESIADFHVFRDKKTVSENFQKLSESADQYGINLLQNMHLKSYLITIYNNYSNYSEIEKILNWFNSYDQKKSFVIASMNNTQKARYAAFLQCISRYYRNRYSNFENSMNYALQAEQVQENVTGYEELKADLYYQLSLNNLRIGNTDQVKRYLPKIPLGTTFYNNIDSMLCYLNGNYNKALDGINRVIEKRLQKIKKDDQVLTSDYLFRSQIQDAEPNPSQK